MNVAIKSTTKKVSTLKTTLFVCLFPKCSKGLERKYRLRAFFYFLLYFKTVLDGFLLNIVNHQSEKINEKLLNSYFRGETHIFIKTLNF